MKRIFLSMILVAVSIVSWAQAPNQISFQAAVRNSEGEIVANKEVSVIFQILQGAPDGEAVFTEDYRLRTNTHGLFSVSMGSKASFRKIQWGEQPYFLKVQIDPNGGNDYTLTSTQQLISVPYALYTPFADTVENIFFVEKQILSMSNDTIYLTGGSYVVLPPEFDGDYNSLINIPDIPINLSQLTDDVGYLTQEVQALRISNDTIYLTGGSYVKLPAGFDGDYNHLTNKPTIPSRETQLNNDAGFFTQEVQVLSIHRDTVFLTGGSYVILPVGEEVQTLADVVNFGNMADGKQLKDLQDPTDPQDVITKEFLDSILVVWRADSTDMGTHNVYIVNACDRYNWNGTIYDQDGVYTYNYSNERGYYSVDTLKLTIRTGSHRSTTTTAYNSYNWYGTIYATSGTYTHQYRNSYGCTSVDTLHLTIHGSGDIECTTYRHASDTATVTECGSYEWYEHYIQESGEYEHSLGKISYQGCDSIVRINVVILPEFQKDTAVRTTNPFTWRGNTYSQQGDYGDTLQASNGCDSIYVLHLMMGGRDGIGAAPGLFSIGNGLKVRFASGNLQVQSSTKYWRFAKQQYSVLNIACAAPYYPSWADIFCWATSGYHDDTDSLCIYHKPWIYTSISAPLNSYVYNNNQYGYGPSHYMTDTNLIGTSKNYDWGVYHPIINGGNGSNLWRLLSQEEWDYLLFHRRNASQLRSYGSIVGIPSETSGYTTSVSGYFLMADDWQCPEGLTFIADTYNSYSLTDWDSLEASGVVFLPTSNTSFYWTNTSGGPGSAYAVALGSMPILASYNRSRAYNVRLAQVHAAGVTDCSCTYFDTTIVSPGNFSWHGITYTESGDYMEAIPNHAGCDSIINLSLVIEDNGELPGLFTIDATGNQIKFSKGNLQYNAAFDIWRFANYQYDYVGAFNRYVSQTYSGWIDLFGWATSGFHEPTDIANTAYHPWSTDGSFGPSRHMSDWDIINTSVNYDWGVYNAIANGGNTVGQWRTLTYSEWQYIYSGRPNAYSLRGSATVNGVKGLILLPDNWVCPDNLIIDPSGNFNTNTYNVPEWEQLEAAGAVFLPDGGYRYGGLNGGYGRYWSSTSSRDAGGWSDYALCFTLQSWGTTQSRDNALSVRLVKDVTTP